MKNLPFVVCYKSLLESEQILELIGVRHHNVNDRVQVRVGGETQSVKELDKGLKFLCNRAIASHRSLNIDIALLHVPNNPLGHLHELVEIRQELGKVSVTCFVGTIVFRLKVKHLQDDHMLEKCLEDVFYFVNADGHFLLVWVVVF